MKRITRILIAGIALAGSTVMVQESRSEQKGLTLPASDTIDVSALGQALTTAGLGDESGRQGLQIDQMTNVFNNTDSNAYLGGNSLTSGSTGSNSISGNAFSNANGIATVIQNSGNQNIIQNSMILNLQMK
jgi:hypothetical protein